MALAGTFPLTLSRVEIRVMPQGLQKWATLNDPNYASCSPAKSIIQDDLGTVTVVTMADEVLTFPITELRYCEPFPAPPEPQGSEFPQNIVEVWPPAYRRPWPGRGGGDFGDIS